MLRNEVFSGTCDAVFDTLRVSGGWQGGQERFLRRVAPALSV
jgi:hypothetical protein